MSSYLSNILTNTTSRYNTLRQTLLKDETDGDTEDDSHISRVLRAYYTEKGRPFPDWLPPDPKRAQAQQQQQQSYTSSGLRNNSPQLGMQQQSKGSLSDLWDTPTQQPAQQQQPTSLRRGAQRTGLGGAGGGGAGMQRGQQQQETAQARPLPSQRVGSYQTGGPGGRAASAEPSPPPSSGGGGGGGGTAQERLKARLWGGRAASPGFAAGGRESPGYGTENQQSPYGGDGGGGRFGRPNGPRDNRF